MARTRRRRARRSTGISGALLVGSSTCGVEQIASGSRKPDQRLSPHVCAEPGKLKLITVVKQGSGTVAPTLCDPREALESAIIGILQSFMAVDYQESWLSMRLLERRGTRQNIRKGARVVGGTPACLSQEEERCHSTNGSPH